MNQKEYNELQGSLSNLIDKLGEAKLRTNKEESYCNGVLAAKSALRAAYQQIKPRVLSWEEAYDMSLGVASLQATAVIEYRMDPEDAADYPEDPFNVDLCLLKNESVGFDPDHLTKYVLCRTRNEEIGIEKKSYGKDCRIWSGWPSDDERLATAWDKSGADKSMKEEQK